MANAWSEKCFLDDQPQQRASFQKFNAEIEVGEDGYLKFKIKK